MITFTDPRKYVFGVGTAIMTDPATGDIVYFSDKFQEANVTVSADDNTLNAGIGNAPAIIIPTNANVQVALTAGDYSEYAKAASVGAAITAGAPVMECMMYTTTTAGSVNLTGAVAGPGMSKAYCYIQRTSEGGGTIAATGDAYEVSGGVIQGFTAQANVVYVISYYRTQANATTTIITSNVKGKVVNFAFQRPIYVNVNPTTNAGDLWGYLYEIVPHLQLMPDGATNNGGQAAYTTTGITGRAIQHDATTISGNNCDACSLGGSPLMYRVIVPCNVLDGIDGIVAELGGTLSLKVGDTYQLKPQVVVNGMLTSAAPGFGQVPLDGYEYESSATSVATVSNKGVVTAGGVGTANITVKFVPFGYDPQTPGDGEFDDVVIVTVTSA